MPEELSTAVGEQIRRLLDAHNIGPTALAKATGIPQSSLSRKLGTTDPARFDLDDVQKICAVLGVDEADLIAWAKRGVEPPLIG